MSVSELRWAGSQAGGPAAHGKTAYLPYIDGLRAWAVLSVMLYHLDARWLPGGFAGVDIFFVISGFVVSVSVANRGPMSLGPFLLFFYARRMRRILPALVAALLATALVSTLFIPASYLSDRNRTTGLLAFFGLSNVILGAPGGDYFSPKAELTRVRTRGRSASKSSSICCFRCCSMHGGRAASADTRRPRCSRRGCARRSRGASGRAPRCTRRRSI